MVQQVWGRRSPRTWNRHLSALGSIVAFCRCRGWPVQDQVAGLDRQREKADNSRVLSFLELDRLWSRESVGLRERACGASSTRPPPARTRSAASKSTTLLRRAFLRGAHLECAYLASAHLERANLRDANLAGANLAHARLQGANLSGATVTREQLREAHVDAATALPKHLRDLAPGPDSDRR
jgi:hypothetical protein